MRAIVAFQLGAQGIVWVECLLNSPGRGEIRPEEHSEDDNLTWALGLADTNRPINGQPIYWNISAPPRYDPIRSVTAQVSF